MKTPLKHSIRLFGILTALCSVLPGQVTAQTFRTLHSFAAGAYLGIGNTNIPFALNLLTNDDGAFPDTRLALTGSTLYGTADSGGTGGSGAIFSVKTDGTAFTSIYSFPIEVPICYYCNVTNNDGFKPSADAPVSGNVLYGTTGEGGVTGNGTVFRVNTDGSGFTALHSFAAGAYHTPVWPNSYTNSDGGGPFGLVVSDNILYGTAGEGGIPGNGTVFRLNTDGTGFTNLHIFSAFDSSIIGATNSDGAWPVNGLVLSDGTLYGTTYYGGSTENGTVFKLNTNGTGFTVLHNFSDFTANGTNSFGYWTNSDGAQPGGVIVSGNTLYGTTPQGGIWGNGTAFKVNTDGTGFTILHSFTGGRPGSLTLSGNTLYGTERDPGSGTIFAMNTDGTGYTNLYSFTAAILYTNSDGSLVATNSDGASPNWLLLSANTLYGTANEGGIWGRGTIFSISFTPQLSIIPSAAGLIISWPTNFAGFDYSGYVLQSTTNLASPIWTTNLPAHSVVNGQKKVTNPISGQQQFFRLSR